MSGVSVDIQIDDEKVLQYLKDLELSDFAMQDLLEVVAGEVEDQTVERFSTNIGPDGKPWKRSRRARRQNGRTLVDSEQLRDSVTSEVIRGAAVVGTNRIYAGIHQFGGKAGRGRSVKMPARPFLGISDADGRDIAAELQDHVERVL